jgi:hypothetical protein
MSEAEPPPNERRHSRAVMRPTEAERDGSDGEPREAPYGSALRVEYNEDHVEPNDEDVERPRERGRLGADDAILLNDMLCQQSSGTQLVAAPGAGASGHVSQRPLYDWFVSVLDVAPWCDTLFVFVERLAARKRRTRRSAPNGRLSRPQPADPTPAAWSDPSGLRV